MATTDHVRGWALCVCNVSDNKLTIHIHHRPILFLNAKRGNNNLSQIILGMDSLHFTEPLVHSAMSPCRYRF